MKQLLSALILLTSLKASALTLGAYNIRNFDYDERARIHTNKSELANIIKSLNVDILSVEEVNNTQEFENFVAKNFPDYDVEISRCGGAHGQHLGFMYRKSVVKLLSFNEDLSISEPGTPGSCDSGSRPLAIGLFELVKTKQRFYGITVHLKSGSNPDGIAKRAKQFQIIKNFISDLRGKTGVKDFFFAGDMNTTEYISRGADYQNLKAVVSQLGMIDVTSNLKCSAYWWGGTQDEIESPSLLDHIVITPGLLKTKQNADVGSHCKVASCNMAPVKTLGISYGQVSDHCPVTSVIQ